MLHMVPYMFSSQPGQNRLICHHIMIEPEWKVQKSLHPLLRKMWDVVYQELQVMLDLREVEEFHSRWQSPIVLVPMVDRISQF